MGPIEIKALRKQTGMSQSDFGRLFGVAGATVGHWETGIRTPPPIYITCMLQLREKIDEILSRFTVLNKEQWAMGNHEDMSVFLAWIFNES